MVVNGWLPALWMVAMTEAFGLVVWLIAAHIGLAIKDLKRYRRSD